MHFSQFIRHVEQGLVAPVYLFTGEAELFMEEAWHLLVERIIPPKARHFNGERLHAKEHSASEVLARLNTINMFGEKRLLLAQQVDAWPKDQRRLIMAYLKRPVPVSCLVMTKMEKKGWEDLAAAVAEVGLVVQFPALTEKDTARWLQERAKRRGKDLSHQGALFMVEHAGRGLHALDRELEKLVSYTGEKEKITLEDVREVVSPHRTFTVFELLDYVSRNQPGQSIASLRNLLRSGEHPLGVLALLARQIRILWQLKDGLERGLQASEMSSHIKLPPSILKKYMEQASKFTQEDLRRIHRAIADADLTMKSSGTSPEWVLEALVFSIGSGFRSVE